MLFRTVLIASALLLSTNAVPTSAYAPSFAPDGSLVKPSNYREWVFLTSGFDMNYAAGAGGPTHSVFDNVFVNPEAYAVFKRSGTWPEGTTFVLENRNATANVSINKAGRTQSREVTGFEVHVKSAAHGGWGFHSFGDGPQAKRIDQKASCYSCHEQHAAVDTTFVQFYPTLMPIAEEKKTLSAAYLKDFAENNR